MPSSKTEAPKDENYVSIVIGVSNVDQTTPVPVAVNPTTNAVIVEVG